MKLSSFRSCDCCLKRRDFLAKSCGLCMATGAMTLPLATNAVGAEKSIINSPQKPRVRLVFSCWALKQDRSTWPNIGYDFREDIRRVTECLQQACPKVVLLPVVAHGPEDAQKLLDADKADRIDGYAVYQMNNWVRTMEPIVASGKPTIVADFLFAGSGGFLVFTSGLRRKYNNFSVVASSRIEDLAEAVKQFEIIGHGGSTAEFVAACDRVRRERTPPDRRPDCLEDTLPPADIGSCLEAMKKSKLVVVGNQMSSDEGIKESLGMELIKTGHTELAAAYDATNVEQARPLAERWKTAARSVSLDDADATLLKSARMHLANQKLLEKYQADAITIDCLGGFKSGQLKAYPCLSFVELLNSGLIGACEADLLSSVTLMAMKHLIGRPGYISDPVLDTSKRQIIYAHCVAATKMFGPHGKACPYEVLSHSEDRQGAAVRSFLPLGYMTTTVEINCARKEILCHRAKAVENVVLDRACRTKLAAEVVGDMEKLMTFWDTYGWHRVTFYGDLWEPLKELAAALDFQFTPEA